MPLIADIHIACLAAGNWAMRGVDPLKEMAPQQVFNVIAAYRKVLDAYEKEAVQDLVRQDGQGREASAG
jgi:hypothetical protein